MADDDGIIFCQSDLKSTSFAVFEDMRRKDELCDLTIRVQNKEISAHRVVVAAGIPYFRSAFASDGNKEIALRDMDSEALESLIDFTYSSRIKISVGNVNHLIFASHFFRLDEILEACVKFISGRFCGNNVWKVRTMALSLDIAHLTELCDLYIQDNTEELLKSVEFLNLPQSHIIDILSKNNLNVSSEKVLFDAVIDWVKFSQSERKAFLPILISQIRMVYVPIDYLSDKAASEEIIRTSIVCRDLIDEVKNYHLFPKKKTMFLRTKTNPRNFSGLYAICSNICSISVRYCDFSNQMWHEVSRTEFDCHLFDNVVLCLEKLYIFHEKGIHIFNTRTLEWQVVLQHCNIDLYGAAVTTAGNVIYAFGSFVDDSSDKVLHFDTEKNIWLQRGRLKTGVSFAAAAALLTETCCVYVIGFIEVQKYCPLTNECSHVASMLRARYSHSAVSMNGKIYVCGNTAGPSAEMYDPSANQWTCISPMNTERFHFSLVSHNSKIYVLGGEGKNCDFPKIEIYHPESNKWESSFHIPEGFKKALVV